MKKINELKWIKTKKVLTIIFPGELPIMLITGTKKYKQVLKLKKRKNLAELINYLFPTKGISDFTQNQVLIVNGKLFLGGEEIPEVIATRIFEFYQKALPWEPLLNFWINLQKNPDKREPKDNVKNHLYPFLQKNHNPITTDGCFIAYRYVNYAKTKKGKENRKKLVDGHSGKIRNNPGDSPSLKRADCDDSSHNSCSRGLHFASYTYGYGGDVMIAIKVNPQDVVAVPESYEGGKGRCCKYLVLHKNPAKITDDWVSPKGLSTKKTKKAKVAKKAIFKIKNSQQTIVISTLTAKEIIQLVKTKTRRKIDLSPKNKKGIVKKATAYLSLKGFKVK